MTIDLALAQLLHKDPGPRPKPAVLRLLDKVYSGSLFTSVDTALIVVEFVAVDAAKTAQFIMWKKLSALSGAARVKNEPRLVYPELYFATRSPRLLLDKASGELKLAFSDQTLMLLTVASDIPAASESESVKLMVLVFSIFITCVPASNDYLEKAIIGLVISAVVANACLVLA